MAGTDGLRIGVLMVGSLYWDKDREHRLEWRRIRLEMPAAQHVKVPIRYGRRSSKREFTYTMVFSTSLNEDQFGQGIVVPCKSRDLIEEAVYLWTAETNCGKNRKCKISASWGCVAVVENPDNPLPEKVRKAWIERVSHERCYGQLDSAKGEKVAVDGRGFLQVPWPETVEEGEIGVDVLLATATNPTIVEGEYASAMEIAGAWMTRRGKKESKYFWNNTNDRIATFQDRDIEERLRARGFPRPD